MTAQDVRRQAREAARQVRRTSAVTAATAMFAEHGFHTTAMADVARAAGISLKALYECFDSKEALFAAVLQDVGGRFARVFPRSDETADPLTRILSFVDDTFAALGENVFALRLYLRGADGVPPAMRERGVDPFAAYTDRLLQAVTEVIALAQAQGRARDMDATVLARALLAMVVQEARHRADVGDDVTAGAAELRPLVSALLAR